MDLRNEGLDTILIAPSPRALAETLGRPGASSKKPKGGESA